MIKLSSAETLTRLTFAAMMNGTRHVTYARACIVAQ